MRRVSFLYGLLCLAIPVLLLSARLTPAKCSTAHIWQIETLATGLGYYGGYATLSLDGAGRPHMAYYDSSSGALKYAVGDSPSPPPPTPPPCYWDSYTAGALPRQNRISAIFWGFVDCGTYLTYRQ